ncbi:hypothetical protein M413DRAFT_448246 [Hebeloma cylindrosporum]|uniref:Uncharacterized protein n=1 Tax=Hebeloma cylindrosporum TaxID=76867 RepID=A0A0C3BLZ5_HEBCY|nr:hypothetical protein M413DRAFT_448246 [Hebeloma cylindrosporum h7]
MSTTFQCTLMPPKNPFPNLLSLPAIHPIPRLHLGPTAQLLVELVAVHATSDMARVVHGWVR